MNQNHPSDLALERLFAGEAEMLKTWRAHVHGCDDCWARWCALHAEEGRPAPKRLTARSRGREALWFGGGLIAGGLVAVALLMSVQPPPIAKTQQLREEASALRLANRALEEELDEVARRVEALRDPSGTAVSEGGRPSTPPGSSTLASGEGRSVVDPTSAPLTEDDIPPDVLEHAVAREIERLTQQKLEVARKRNTEHEFMRLGEIVDAFVAAGDLDGIDAGEVEYLLQAEIEQTWDIKAQAVEEGLSEQAAVTAWEALLASTDEELDALVGTDTRESIREALHGRK